MMEALQSSFEGSMKFMKYREFWITRSDFYRDIAQALADKELFRDFIEGELKIALGEKTRDKIKAGALDHARLLMNQGLGTFEVLAAIMPSSDLMGIAVARDAKDRPAALRYLAENIDRQNAMTKVVRGALASPVILLPVGFVFSWVLAGFSIPLFVGVAPPEVWTGFALFVREAAFLFSTYGHWIFIGLVIGLMWFVVWGLENLTSNWRFRAEDSRGLKKLTWLLLGPVQPMLEIYRDVQSSRALANIAVLLQAGRGLQDALMDIAHSSPPWLKRHLHWIVEHLQLAPGDYVGAFSHGFLSKSMLSRLHSKVRRDAGQEFAKVLIEIGTAGQEKARDDVKSASIKANIILIAASLGLIMFFYMGQNWIIYRMQDEMSPEKIKMRALQKAQGVSQSSSNK